MTIQGRRDRLVAAPFQIRVKNKSYNEEKTKQERKEIKI